MSLRRSARRAAAVRALFLLVAGVGAGANCRSATDSHQSDESGSTNVSGLSFVLEPTVVSVSQGATAQTIGTIRGASGLVSSVVNGVPSGVSVRVTSAAVTDTGMTYKYIFFADGAASPGTYTLSVRVTTSGHPDMAAQLTLTVAGP